jgi:hypothetical protein
VWRSLLKTSSIFVLVPVLLGNVEPNHLTVPPLWNGTPAPGPLPSDICPTGYLPAECGCIPAGHSCCGKAAQCAGDAECCKNDVITKLTCPADQTFDGQPAVFCGQACVRPGSECCNDSRTDCKTMGAAPQPGEETALSVPAPSGGEGGGGCSGSSSSSSSTSSSSGGSSSGGSSSGGSSTCATSAKMKSLCSGRQILSDGAVCRCCITNQNGACVGCGDANCSVNGGVCLRGICATSESSPP